MKQFAIALALITSGHSFGKSLNVRVTEEGRNIHIAFSTVATHSSMCNMVVTDASLSYGNIQGRDIVKNGKVELQAKRLPITLCLMAFGPHRGTASFSRGYSLPQLLNGQYELRINGESYGTLTVADGSVNLNE